MWPTYFAWHSEIAGYLSARFHCLASTVQVYDSDTWHHVVYDDGKLIDEHAADPSYEVSELVDRRAAARRWHGSPEAVARHLGGSAREIARHYRRNRRSRSFDDRDFTKVWREVGITFPLDEVPSPR